MADRETALVVSANSGSLAELKKANEVFGKPEEDKERAPQFEKRIFLIKTLNNAQMFECEDPAKPGGEKVRANEVRGVLVHFNATRSWWEKDIDSGGGGNAPDCHSIDGIRPLKDSPKKQCDTCSACPRNKFVKDENGKSSKDCSDKIELFLWHPKYELPLFYRVSTMNRPVITDFINWCAKEGVRKEFFTLRLTLTKTKNKGGVEYDKLNVEVTGDIRDLVQWYKKTEDVDLTWQAIADQLQIFKDENSETFGMALGEENAIPPAAADAASKPAADATPKEKTPTDAKKKTKGKPDTADPYAVKHGEPPF